MNTNKLLIIFFLAALFWMSWLFRYEPMVQGESGAMLLDHWTGKVLVTSSKGVAWFDVADFETFKKDTNKHE